FGWPHGAGRRKSTQPTCLGSKFCPHCGQIKTAGRLRGPAVWENAPWRARLPELLQCDFDVHTSRQIEAHESVHGLVGGVDDVHQTLVRTDFELVARRLVDVRRAQNVVTADARGQRYGAT